MTIIVQSFICKPQMNFCEVGSEIRKFWSNSGMQARVTSYNANCNGDRGDIDTSNDLGNDMTLTTSLALVAAVIMITMGLSIVRKMRDKFSDKGIINHDK